MSTVVDIDDGGKHQHRTGHRVQEEFDRRVDAALVAPDADQKIHRHQANFPEHIKQEEVLCHEYTGQAEFQQKQKGEELKKVEDNKTQLEKEREQLKNEKAELLKTSQADQEKLTKLD